MSAVGNTGGGDRKGYTTMTFHTQGAIGCPRDKISARVYGHAMPVDERVFLAAFTPAGARCGTCGHPLDLETLWDRVQEHLMGIVIPGYGADASTWKPLMQTSMALGLLSTIIPVTLQQGRPTQVKFGDQGVPPNARILATSVTVQNGVNVLPLEFISQQRVVGEAIPHETMLFPWAYPGSDGRDTEVSIWVLWVTDSFVSPSFIHLVDALLHYTHDEFGKCVRSAQLAIEEPLKDLVERAFAAKKVGFQRTLGRLLHRKGAAEIREALLPAVTEDLGLPPMPARLAEGLKKLATARNDASHNASADVSEVEARDGLVAALFGIYYAFHFDGLLKTI